MVKNVLGQVLKSIPKPKIKKKKAAPIQFVDMSSSASTITLPNGETVPKNNILKIDLEKGIIIYINKDGKITYTRIEVGK